MLIREVDYRGQTVNESEYENWEIIFTTESTDSCVASIKSLRKEAEEETPTVGTVNLCKGPWV